MQYPILITFDQQEADTMEVEITVAAIIQHDLMHERWGAASFLQLRGEKNQNKTSISPKE